MPNTGGFGNEIALTTPATTPSGVYTDVTQVPFDVGVTRDVEIVDSAALLEAGRQSNWSFGGLYPTGSRYFWQGNGTKDFVLDLEGVNEILRWPVWISNYHRIKIIAPEHRFRVSDQTNYPRSFPTSVCPYPPLNGATIFRIAPATESKVWIEGSFADCHDASYQGGMSLSTDGLVWRGEYGHASGYANSSFMIQNTKWTGLVGSNKQPNGSPHEPEIHSDMLHNQTIQAGDPMARPLFHGWENFMFSGEMGGWAHRSGGNGTTANSDIAYMRNFNIRLTRENANQFRTGHGVAFSSGQFLDYTPSNFFSKGRITLINGHHSRYTASFFAALGEFQNKNCYIVGHNQSITNPGIQHPELTWDGIPQPGVWSYEPVHEDFLGTKYTSPHTHNHR